jgi:hypothetical protein
MRVSAANLFTNFQKKASDYSVRSHPTPSAKTIELIEEFGALSGYAQSNVQWIPETDPDTGHH